MILLQKRGFGISRLNILFRIAMQLFFFVFLKIKYANQANK